MDGSGCAVIFAAVKSRWATWAQRYSALLWRVVWWYAVHDWVNRLLGPLWVGQWAATFSAKRSAPLALLVFLFLACSSGQSQTEIDRGRIAQEPEADPVITILAPSPTPVEHAPVATPTPVLMAVALPTPTLPDGHAVAALFTRVPDVGVALALPGGASHAIDQGLFAPAGGVLIEVAHPGATPRWEPTPDGAPRSVRAPILMYHYLSIPPPNADIYRRDLSVAPALFRQHLERIEADGYTTVSLYELIAHLAYGAPLPERPVILTFDDGYRDNYENAFPLLVEQAMTATFFVVTDFIDEGRPEYLTWDMAREMHAAGMSIESHGRNHVSLRGKDADYLVWQALGSLETIEFELGVRPRFISYPAGEYDRQTLEIFRSANFWAGVTTIQGATHESEQLFELRRVRIRGSTTPDELARLLALDW